MFKRTSLSRPSRLSRPPRRLRTARPIARVRYAAGRHRTLWRVLSAGVALAAALTLSPPPAAQSALPNPSEGNGLDQLDQPILGHTGAPSAGAVGVALPRTAAFPLVEVGSFVHAVAVNDPLVSGEVRGAKIIVRRAFVLEVDDQAVTIEVDESDAVALVEATTVGSVVLVTAGAT